MGTLFIIVGIILFIIGLIGRVNSSKYEFNNRTEGGVVNHKSYGRAYLHYLSKGFFDILMILGILISVYGYFYDPYSGKYPGNWGSMSNYEKRMWKNSIDNPESYEKMNSETTIDPYKILNEKEFDDWAKQLEIETGISALIWRDIANNTEKKVSFKEQEELMRKWHFSREMVQGVKKEYEFDPNNPLDVFRVEQKKRESERKK